MEKETKDKLKMTVGFNAYKDAIKDTNEAVDGALEDAFGKKGSKAFKIGAGLLLGTMLTIGVVGSNLEKNEAAKHGFNGKYVPTEQQEAARGSVMTATNSVVESAPTNTTNIDPESTKGYWERFEKRHANDPEPIPDKTSVDTSTTSGNHIE